MIFRDSDEFLGGYRAGTITCGPASDEPSSVNVIQRDAGLCAEEADTPSPTAAIFDERTHWSRNASRWSPL
jgi:hypothetical protein